jgi:hypothetical protein
MNSEKALKLVLFSLCLVFIMGIIAGLVGSVPLLVVAEVIAACVALSLVFVPILIWREVERMRADAAAHAEKLLAAVKAERSRPAPAATTPSPLAADQTRREIESAPVRRIIEIAPP